MHVPTQRRRRAVAIAAAVAIALPIAGCQFLADIATAVMGVPPRPPFPPAPAASTPSLHADRIVVFKRARVLELLHGGQVVARFPVALGEHPQGPKQHEGDGRTPEGRYVIDGRSADTRYTAELHISYPDAQDRARAQAMHVEPGGAIFIHGLPRDFGPYDPPQWYRDWTDGCIAVGNRAVQTIWNAAPDGTPIDILP